MFLVVIISVRIVHLDESSEAMGWRLWRVTEFPEGKDLRVEVPLLAVTGFALKILSLTVILHVHLKQRRVRLRGVPWLQLAGL